MIAKISRFAMALPIASIALLANLNAQVLFQEDFESLPLGTNVEEGFGLEVFQEIPPKGWDIVNEGVLAVTEDADGNPVSRMDNGVYEWVGWSFADKQWWVNVAGDQRRSEFVNGQGTVMIADPDEWDDQSHPDSASNGWYRTFITTPSIDLSGQDANSTVLVFDSSWRDEFDGNYHQTVNITASYDGGAASEILLWESDPDSDNFKDDTPNETVILGLNNPGGASNLKLTFGMFEAGNDWWWAVDNIKVAVPPVATGVSATASSFDLLLLEGLGKTIDESTLTIQVDGADVTGSTVRNDLSGDFTQLVFSYAHDSLWVSESLHTINYSFTTGDGVQISSTIDFTVPRFVTIPAGLKLADVDTSNEGFIMRVIQADQGLATSIAVREDHLAGRLLDANGDPLENYAFTPDTLYPQVDGEESTWFVPLINLEQDGNDQGEFNGGATAPMDVLDNIIPGIPGDATADTDNITAEIFTVVRIPEPGMYTFGFNSDDGFQVTAGNLLDIEERLVLGEFDGSRGSSTTSFPVAFEEAGDYQMRALWFEGTGGANLEWFTITPNKALLNDTDNGGLKTFAFRSGNPLALTSVSPANGTGGAPLAPTVSFTLVDGSTTLDAASIAMTFGGADVTPEVNTTDGTHVITYTSSKTYGNAEEVNATLTFSDSTGRSRTASTTFRTLRDDLLAYWDFNDDSDASSSEDLNPNIDLPASLVGNAAFSADAAGVSGAAGDRSMSFGDPQDGSSLLVQSDFFNEAAYQDTVTIALWQKWNTDVTDSSAFWVVSPTTGGSARSAQAHIPWSNGNVYFDTSGCCDAATQRLNQAITDFDPNFDWTEWHHFTFVKNKEVKQIYVDGQPWLETINTGALPTDNVQLWIGAAPQSGNSIGGWIDNFAVFSSALTADEISQLFAGAAPQDIKPWAEFAASSPAPTSGISGIAVVDGGVTISFEGVLKSSTTVNGSYAPVAGASAPSYTVNPDVAETMFFIAE
jgi:hypothetical protein